MTFLTSVIIITIIAVVSIAKCYGLNIILVKGIWALGPEARWGFRWSGFQF